MFLFSLICLAAMGTAMAAPDCPQCDPTEYKPVCTSTGKAFTSLCQFQRQVCLGTVELSDYSYGNCFHQRPNIAHNNHPAFRINQPENNFWEQLGLLLQYLARLFLNW